MDELITGVGSVDRTAALKALITWVDLGVLKEDEENVFRLLEVAEEPTPGGRDPVSRPGECHQRFCLYCPPYLHVNSSKCIGTPTSISRSSATSGADEDVLEGLLHLFLSIWVLADYGRHQVHRGNAHEPWDIASRPNTNDAQIRTRLRSKYRPARRVHGSRAERRVGYW